MLTANKKLNILIYGFGNPGRRDDGLGYELVTRLNRWTKNNNIDIVDFDCNYQLNIEDAYDISTKDIVIFADASTEDIQDFILTKVDENSGLTFTTHEASPGYIYYLSKTLFNKTPATYLLHIKGYKWDFKQGLTKQAEENLKKALEFLKPLLVDPVSLYSDDFIKLINR